MESDLRQLQKVIGYEFKDGRLLRTALTHSSYANEMHLPRSACNERLEFLGDAVLEIASSRFLFFKYRDYPEGELTKLRASIVCEPTLAMCARKIGLGEYLFLGKCEQIADGRNNASVISDAMEALLGAIYLDGGYESASAFVSNFILDDIEHKELFYDSKTRLQEIVQRNGKSAVTYRLVKEEGPDHAKRFFVEAVIDGVCRGEGSGRTKKAAEQDAALRVLTKLTGGKTNG